MLSLDTMIAGLSIASILLLVALGLAIIYGTMGVINLAHGDFLMIGAYATWYLQRTWHIGLLPSIPIVFLVGGLLGLLLEKTIVQFLYKRPLDTILATWGISILLEESVNLTAGANSKYVQLPVLLSGHIAVAGVSIAMYRLMIICVSLLLLLLTVYIFNCTEFGLKIRAVVSNSEIAEAHGVNSKRIYALTFAYGSGLAALAGALIAPIKSVSPAMGVHYVVDAFIVVVVGGVGSLFGLVMSSALVGEMESILGYLLNDTTAKVLIFLAVIAVIRVRPSGLFASKVREVG